MSVNLINLMAEAWEAEQARYRVTLAAQVMLQLKHEDGFTMGEEVVFIAPNYNLDEAFAHLSRLCAVAQLKALQGVGLGVYVRDSIIGPDLTYEQEQNEAAEVVATGGKLSKTGGKPTTDDLA
jgi:hypothetical protein